MIRMIIPALLLAMAGTAQPFAEVNIGMTSRLGIAPYVNAGYIFADRNYSGPMVAGTAGIEQGMGSNVGGYAGWQWYGIAFYGGAGYFRATNSKLEEGSRMYPIAGMQYRYPENRAVIDLRLMGDAIHLGFGIRIGKNHNK